jgi:hypothetical protein
MDDSGHPEPPPEASFDNDPAPPELRFGPNTRPSPDARVLESPAGEPWIVNGLSTSWSIIPIGAAARNAKAFQAALLKATKHLSLKRFSEGMSARKRTSLRNKLSALYRSYWGSTNRSSLMMLVSPGSRREGGWLCTGDADLTSSEIHNECRRLGAFFAGVDAGADPHHGSPKNFDQRAAALMMSLAGNRLTWVISSGRNKWKYPDPNVVAACRATGTVIQTNCATSWSQLMSF